jgi:hypothetical protein
MKFLRTVTRGRNLLEFQRVFSTNPLIKTYVTLCQSCRSIAPLQILFLDIFEYDDTFWSFIISKRESRNKIGSGDIDAAPARAHVRDVASTWQLCAVPRSTPDPLPHRFHCKPRPRRARAPCVRAAHAARQVAALLARDHLVLVMHALVVT